MDILIRSERATDAEAISQVTYAAFLGKFSNHPTEHLIVDGLREAGALTLSLVAEADGKVAGHVAFSPSTSKNRNCSWKFCMYLFIWFMSSSMELSLSLFMLNPSSI